MTGLGNRETLSKKTKVAKIEQPSIIYGYYGAVAERLKATVLKTVVRLSGTGGSNPSCSVLRF